MTEEDKGIQEVEGADSLNALIVKFKKMMEEWGRYLLTNQRLKNSHFGSLIYGQDSRI